VTLHAFADERRAAAPLLLGAGARRSQLISPARTAFSSKPAARRCCCRSMGQTDGQTDGRALDLFIYPAPHTTRAVPDSELMEFINILPCDLQLI